MSEVRRAHWDADHEQGIDCYGCLYSEPRKTTVELVYASDFDAEHAMRLEAERQVGELREQLADAEHANALGDHVIIRLQAKLDTAMGLLRSLKHGIPCWSQVDDFLNTTSTEGKDHE